ncbi:hypothetical protein HMPREF1141_0166 [Clostridium sp. MSTE9]|nr:hypothetical protein HMPREF1141_0166 [Clostridium sp. MSTE9]
MSSNIYSQKPPNGNKKNRCFGGRLLKSRRDITIRGSNQKNEKFDSDIGILQKAALLT